MLGGKAFKKNEENQTDIIWHSYYLVTLPHLYSIWDLLFISYLFLVLLVFKVEIHENGIKWQAAQFFKHAHAYTEPVLTIQCNRKASPPFSLTLNTQSSVFIFSILFPVHLLRRWQGEFVKQSSFFSCWSFLLFSWP